MLSDEEAFEAMRYFLHEFWKRGGSRADTELARLLSWTGSDVWVEPGTNDPAQWEDWLDAVRAVQAGERAP